MPPGEVCWRAAGASQGGLFETCEPQPAASPGAAPRVPRWYAGLVRQVVMHSDPGRFSLLYRLLWRLHREPGLRDDTLDPDRIQAERMARAVSREIHKMHAFVRFRPVRERPGQPDAQCLHLAWFDPAHPVLEAAAPFFVKRFAKLRWSILTPALSVHCDGSRLSLDAGVPQRPAAEAAANAGRHDGEALWLAYYRSIFNPARLKAAAMMREMPRRYWSTLPESAEISGLIQQANERSGRMIAAGREFASSDEFP